MENKNYETLGNVANYLNEMAIRHRLISASTASAFAYMAREEITLKKLKTLLLLMLKIKEENGQIALTHFHREITNLKTFNIETILTLMSKAIEKPLELEDENQEIIPHTNNFVQIGRSSKPEHGNDIVFPNDKTLSRVHLVINVVDEQYFLEDRSANGTFVNGSKIEKGVRTPVSIKDKISIGREGTLVKLEHPKIVELRMK
jgi:hypothetical protein